VLLLLRLLLPTWTVPLWFGWRLVTTSTTTRHSSSVSSLSLSFSCSASTLDDDYQTSDDGKDDDNDEHSKHRNNHHPYDTSFQPALYLAHEDDFVRGRHFPRTLWLNSTSTSSQQLQTINRIKSKRDKTQPGTIDSKTSTNNDETKAQYQPIRPPKGGNDEKHKQQEKAQENESSVPRSIPSD
jgi:hypothetical protein